TGRSPVVAAVHGVAQANPRAVMAIQRADLILLGPGSFYTSTISTIVTGDLAYHICQSSAPKILILNLDSEAGRCAGFL
ncbi:hypothetical protein EO238_34150, partial [Citrobacter sp. AAK_AS5]